MCKRNRANERALTHSHARTPKQRITIKQLRILVSASAEMKCARVTKTHKRRTKRAKSQIYLQSKKRINLLINAAFTRIKYPPNWAHEILCTDSAGHSLFLLQYQTIFECPLRGRTR